ncbi:MAG: hypothetical protein ACO24M_07625 [Limnohabitans sp.]|jgi:hypothetical protein|nr:hypothetical protein [Burkholderiaceae bacterium]
MRTTLDLDEDILAAAKSLAKAGQTTAGRIISDTMRRAIQLGLADPAQARSTTVIATEPQAVYGFLPLTAPGQQIVTSDMVRAIRDDIGE